MMKLAGKKIAVIGMGKTGISVAAFLGGRGAMVIVADAKPSREWGSAFERMAGESWLRVGEYGVSILDGVDLVVPSPGIPPGHEILNAARKMNIPIMSEIELAFRFIRVPIIAVSGTNGKTTTTTLLGQMLAHAGKPVFVGGNIGNPLIEYAATDQTDHYIVAEISSFQLQWADTFRPHIALLLNITCDHVDYHGSFEEYRRIKLRLFEHQNQGDLAVLNADDDAQKGIASSLRSQVVTFSSGRKLPEGIFLQDHAMIYRRHGSPEESYPLKIIELPGLHNVENVMAAIVAARFCGCSSQNIVEAVSSFRGLPHRIEFAGEKQSVKYYDDSKGTNVDAVVRALQTFQEPVILLLGGRDKDGNFKALLPFLPSRAKQVILFGEARERIESQLGPHVPLVKAETLEAAVRLAHSHARLGDIVLLSPGCASFDEFANYRERGNYFKKVVGML